MASFFESPNSSTSSAIVKVEYEVRFRSDFDGFLSRDRPAALLLKSCSGVCDGQAILAVFFVVARKSSKMIIKAFLRRLHIHVLFYYELFSYLLFYLELRSRYIYVTCFFITVCEGVILVEILSDTGHSICFFLLFFLITMYRNIQYVLCVTCPFARPNYQMARRGHVPIVVTGVVVCLTLTDPLGIQP